MKRGFAGLAAGTHEVRFGGPGRGRTYGPLIKRCPVDQTPQTQEHVSEQKNKESRLSISCWMSLGWGIPVVVW